MNGKLMLVAIIIISVGATMLVIVNYPPSTVEYYTEIHVDTVDEILGTDMGTWVFQEGKEPYRLTKP